MYNEWYNYFFEGAFVRDHLRGGGLKWQQTIMNSVKEIRRLMIMSRVKCSSITVKTLCLRFLSHIRKYLAQRGEANCFLFSVLFVQ